MSEDSDAPGTASMARVGDRPLWVGDAWAADPRYHDRTFDRVVTVAAEARPLTDDHHPLADGPATTPAEFRAAVDAARAAVRRAGDRREAGAAGADGDGVLVHCSAGVSRSVAVAATVIAAEDGCPFDDALDAVAGARPAADPHPALRALARAYLGEPVPAGEAGAREADDGRPPLVERIADRHGGDDDDEDGGSGGEDGTDDEDGRDDRKDGADGGGDDGRSRE